MLRREAREDASTLDFIGKTVMVEYVVHAYEHAINSASSRRPRAAERGRSLEGHDERGNTRAPLLGVRRTRSKGVADANCPPSHRIC